MLYIIFILSGFIINRKNVYEELKESYTEKCSKKIHDIGSIAKTLEGNVDPKHEHKIQTILSNTNFVNKEISKHGKEISPININTLIYSITDDYIYDFDTEIQINIDPKLPNLMLDEHKVRSILHNLILNAIEHIKERKYERKITANIYFFERKLLFLSYQYLIFRIENQGEINKIISQKIYEKGFSTKNKDTRNSGIGLYESRGFAEKMGGTLKHTSINNIVSFELIIPTEKISY